MAGGVGVRMKCIGTWLLDISESARACWQHAATDCAGSGFPRWKARVFFLHSTLVLVCSPGYGQ